MQNFENNIFVETALKFLINSCPDSIALSEKNINSNVHGTFDLNRILSFFKTVLNFDNFFHFICSKSAQVTITEKNNLK